LRRNITQAVDKYHYFRLENAANFAVQPKSDFTWKKCLTPSPHKPFGATLTTTAPHVRNEFHLAAQDPSQAIRKFVIPYHTDIISVAAPALPGCFVL